MIAERISLEAICRLIEIKPHQVYGYMDEPYEENPADLSCQLSDKQKDIDLFRVDSELDELWSFVGYKANKQWLWVKCDPATVYWLCLLGAEGALGLWQAIPKLYRQQARFYTDDWAAIPADQHRFNKQKRTPIMSNAFSAPCEMLFSAGSIKPIFF